ncbi:SURF1 family protein [Andreprevotia chitinilytica]|uniref:SURF1 family protein n=1 Tax=Andreprevotia chitinilytica TaxID=396808 RepID=UPI00054E630C|nr:SURF1 family protein [Andreprevotia chitinilytica]
MSDSPSSDVIESSYASTAATGPHAGSRGKSRQPILLLLLIVVTIGLGAWQLCRALQKQRLVDAYHAEHQKAPQPWRGGSIPDWQRRQPIGGWLDQQTFYLAPRYRDGVAGLEVVTPLQLASGEIVLVNRGWLAEGHTPSAPNALPQVETQPWPRFLELGPTPVEHRRMQNLTAERAAALTGLAKPIAYARQSDDSADGLTRNWPEPDFNPARHVGYMLTWWGMSICGVLLMYRLRKEQRRG